MSYQDELEELKLEGIEEEDIEAAKKGSLDEPEFPFLIFTLAVAKDIVDWLSVETVGLIGSLVTLVVAPIMFIHYRGKASRIKRTIYKRMATAVIASLIPGVNVILPEWSLFVIIAYSKDRSQVLRIIDFAAKFGRSSKLSPKTSSK
ncbi:MAG: hypothetical protein HY454_00165 [Parcubacteria group bacterium]|nr:hypothetical protein [Parcubacteria group bacterium]